MLRSLHLPLPRMIRFRRLESLSYQELEDAVLDSCRVERQWMRWREPGLTLSVMDEHFYIRLLDFLDDRWIISAPSGGPPTIWDARENPPKLYERMLPFRGAVWGTTAAANPHQGGTIIALRE